MIQLLHNATGVDFSNYKFNTLYRRVTRRMVFQKLDGLPQYVEFLKQTPAEVDALYQDILISVTSFFRDPESFEALKSQVFPRLLRDRSRNDPVRLWTLGCSTGQEAYSLTMAFAEAAEAAGSSVPLQVFATDLNPAVIDKARAGIYLKDIAQDVSPERLRRFFSETDGSYRIAKSIRDSCIFSRHNVLSDPPFSRIDLISCRNLLIYLEPVLQQRIMPTLHYALKPTGCLWLGGSETIGTYRNLFDAEDAKHKIYLKKSGSVSGPGHFSLQHGGLPRSPFVPITPRPSDGLDLNREADRLLSAKFAPPGVLVSADLDILQFRGDTSPYLAPGPGKASLNLLKMLREGLLVGVCAAVLKAGQQEAPVREEGLRVRCDAGYLEVAIEVIAIKARGENAGGFLILFEDASRANSNSVSRVASAPGLDASDESSDPDAPKRPGHSTPRVRGLMPPGSPEINDQETARLSQELAATRDYLQSVIEEQEAANEELQSANEEVQSANEELQSSNEELETSKEEIQSSNDELNNRNEELNRLNNDLFNLFASIQTAIVVVGGDLRIRRFTPTAEKLLGLIAADIGRPLTDLKLKFANIPELEPLLAEVLDSIITKECEVRDTKGRWYALRLRPYRTLDHKIDGVVVILVDIDLLKRAHAYTESIVATVREPLLVRDSNLRVQSASASFYRTYLVTQKETIGRLIYELGNGQWDIPELRHALEEILPKANEIRDYELERDFENIGVKTVRLNARRLIQVKEHDPLILLAIEDITEAKRQTNALRQLAADLTEGDRCKNEFLAILAHELRNPLAPIRNAVQVLRLSNTGGEAVQSAASMMERQIGQMVRLVDDLLDVSRINSGKIELRRERVELAYVIHQAVEATRSLYQSMNHELTIALPPQQIYLNADPTRLAQVVGNLLNNACKFTDQGGKISLTVEVEESGEGRVARRKTSAMTLPLPFLPSPLTPRHSPLFASATAASQPISFPASSRCSSSLTPRWSVRSADSASA